MKYTDKYDVTIVLPIKGQYDVRLFNNILRPSLDKIRGCKLLVITNEDIDPLPTEYLPAKVIKDSMLGVPDMEDVDWHPQGISGAWLKQQLIKLESWRFVDTPWILTMDSDCVFLFEGHINLLMPQGKPFLSWSHQRQITGDQKLWWQKASELLGKPLPEIRCTVTPMFLKTDVLKSLCENHDVADYISRGTTEYSLYWVYGGDINDYHQEELMHWQDAYWNTGGDVLKAAEKIYHSAGRLGLIQSTTKKQDEWKGKDLASELIKIYKRRP